MNTPKVLVVGGPDVDARLELMHYLRDDFDINALGTESTIHTKFAASGFDYNTYHLSRRANPIVDLWGMGRLISFFRQLQPQIVHTFATKPGVWGRLAAYLAGVPIIIGTLPGLGSLYANDNLKTHSLRLVYEPLQKWACHVSDLTIFQNHDDVDQFVTKGIVPGHKAMVIPGSGVDTSLFDPSRILDSERVGFKNELGIGSHELVVTMISRVIRSKGVLEFMAAAQYIRRDHPNVRFLLIGPDDKGSVDQLTPEELVQLRQVVTWPGPSQNVPVVLACSDIFVLPSAYREGIPRVLLESASMGLPIVTSDAPGCNEVVKHGANGFLVPVRDSLALSQAILQLIEQPELRQRFGQHSRQRAVEQFELSVIAEQIRSVYKHLLAQTKPGN